MTHEQWIWVAVYVKSWYTQTEVMVMELKIEDRDLMILEYFKDIKVPLGAWQIANLMANDGIESSTATIGRRLNKLENAGYLAQDCKYRGRHITAQGIKALALKKHMKDISLQSMHLEKYLVPELLEDFKTILEVRRIVESGTARLAAMRATEQEISDMEDLLLKEEQKYKYFWINRLDVEFHISIAKAAKNAILESLYSQILGMGQQSTAFEYLRKRIKAGFVSNHRKVLEAIKKRDAAAAEAAMQEHIDSLIGDLKTYYDTFIFEEAKQGGGEA